MLGTTGRDVLRPNWVSLTALLRRQSQQEAHIKHMAVRVIQEKVASSHDEPRRRPAIRPKCRRYSQSGAEASLELR
jgi:hypothetical protein